MSNGGIEAKYLGPGELGSGPYHKRLKSTAETYVLPHHGSTDLHRVQEKTGSDWVPLTVVDVRGQRYPQVNKTETTDLLKPFCNEMPDSKPDGIGTSQGLHDINPPLLTKDDEIYSTSTAFIGPIYKPPEKKKCSEKADNLNGIKGKRRREEKQKFNSRKPEIDSELSQFYKEIEELENEKDDSEGSCKEPEPSPEQLTPSPCYQYHVKDPLKSDGEKEDFKAVQSHCDYQQCLGDESASRHCNGQQISTFRDTSFPSFRPEWQSLPPFIVPHGPPPPSFNCQLNIQQFGALPNPPPNIFHAQDESRMQNGHHVNSCHVRWNSLAPNENSSYVDLGERNVSTHPPRDGYSTQDGYVNGFCEIREGCWKDPSVDKHNGIDRFASQQYQEAKLNKLQKLLILLRGLPGSGKTTLSRRNKHGVSRKKIAQMLDRYEFQMSISIVMNSVEPPQKSTQRPPPPPPGTPRERVLNKAGYLLYKTKQKRNRKRKKQQSSPRKIMPEKSSETLSYVVPANGDPSQSEEEDFAEITGESACPSTSNPGNEVQDSVSGCKEKSWKCTDPGDGFPKCETKLDNTPPYCPAKEGDDLLLTFSSGSNESSVTCPIGMQDISCETKNVCSDMKVEKQTGQRLTLTSEMPDPFAEIPSSFMQKREMADKSLSNEPILCRQHGSRALDEACIEERGVHTTENNWAFFTTSLTGEELQQGSDRQPYLGVWPEGPHKFVCEQRSKRNRSRKQACPDSRRQLVRLISTFEGVPEPESSPETVPGDTLPIGAEDVSPPAETAASFTETETSILPSSPPDLDVPESGLESTMNTKKRPKRIFNLASSFCLQEQKCVSAKEREECGLVTNNHGFKILLEGTEDRISEINSQEEDKQKIITCDHQPSWFHLDAIKDSPINIGGQFYSHCLSFNRLRHCVYFYENSVPSLVLHYMFSYWKISFTNKRPFLTFKSQTRASGKLNDVGFVSSGILSDQPDALHSLRVTSELHFLNGRFDEKLKTREASKSLQCLPSEEIQDVTHTGFPPLGLPLSQGFAIQLVKLFGPPGIPMESLLPEDYVIPLDRKTLKMIYLQWKTSIEERQKKIGLKNENSLSFKFCGLYGAAGDPDHWENLSDAQCPPRESPQDIRWTPKLA
ncbi:NEDD4-binding protein 2-like 2 isoform X2 [Ochotona princeps]|uniref:NEDD4-binding protein 2-like 2 isoform X2 n=1 Tax=Ochotona princeps TaxID=9978 RepID=UPI00271547F1|nr:NEDD4-binding protein 2-like 2 isoform X2 [Ochotona princeps]